MIDHDIVLVHLRHLVEGENARFSDLCRYASCVDLGFYVLDNMFLGDNVISNGIAEIE